MKENISPNFDEIQGAELVVRLRPTNDLGSQIQKP